MFVDCDRHVGVGQYSDLFSHMPLAWQRHFERVEFVSSIDEASNHIRVSERWDHPHVDVEPPADDGDEYLLVPHQGLTINGWADRVGAKVFAAAINSYGLENWAGPTRKLALVVSPHDPAWSAAEVTRLAHAGSGVGAVAIPLGDSMLGSFTLNPIYEACVEADVPVLVHFSGVEGRYLGAPPLSGGVHLSAFSRLSLMPHLAESNVTSLVFEGAFETFPDLRVIFAGFGFTWLPSLMWRMDREWRTFRHDLPWVKEPPSTYLPGRLWVTTSPVEEAAISGEWDRSFSSQQLRSLLAFGSHQPFDGDSAADVTRVLGDAAAAVLTNGKAAITGSRESVSS
jgi:hypothetical protein